MIIFIISVIIIGFVAGLIARAVLPGDDSMGLVATTVLGIVGSLVGGFLGYLLFGADKSSGAFQTAGLIGSILGAIVVLLVMRVAGRRQRV